MERWKKHCYMGIFSILIGIISFVLLFAVFPIVKPAYRHHTMILSLVFGIIELQDAFKHKKGRLINENGP